MLFYHVALKIVSPENRQSYTDKTRGNSSLHMAKTMQILTLVLLEFSQSTP